MEPDKFCLNLIVALIDPDFGVASALSSSLQLQGHPMFILV